MSEQGERARAEILSDLREPDGEVRNLLERIGDEELWAGAGYTANVGTDSTARNAKRTGGRANSATSKRRQRSSRWGRQRRRLQMSKRIPAVDLRVPNTPAGLRFLGELRYYAAERYGEIAARPRGNPSRRGSDYDSDREGCTAFGVYLRPSKKWRAQEQRTAEWRAEWRRKTETMVDDKHRREMSEQAGEFQRLLLDSANRTLDAACDRDRLKLRWRKLFWFNLAVCGIAAGAVGIILGALFR